MNAATNAMLDIEALRQQFQVLRQDEHGRPPVYLDLGATTQKPHAVINAISRH